MRQPTDRPTWLPWRVGRKVGRTIYAQVGALPSDNDPLIGLMDTFELAHEAVNAHNHALPTTTASSTREAGPDQHHTVREDH